MILQAKSEEALLQTRADFDSHVASGRNEHAQISSKLESETQTRTRLESEVRHVINVMCTFNNMGAGWPNGRWVTIESSRYGLIFLFLLCFTVILGNTLFSHISSLHRIGTYFILLRCFLCIQKNKTRQRTNFGSFRFQILSLRSRLEKSDKELERASVGRVEAER